MPTAKKATDTLCDLDVKVREDSANMTPEEVASHLTSVKAAVKSVNGDLPRLYHILTSKGIMTMTPSGDMRSLCSAIEQALEMKPQTGEILDFNFYAASHTNVHVAKPIDHAAGTDTTINPVSHAIKQAPDEHLQAGENLKPTDYHEFLLMYL